MTWTTTLLLAIAAAAVCFAGGAVGSWLAGALRDVLERNGADPAARRLLVVVVRPVVVVIAVVAALGLLGLDPNGLVVVLGATTLAVGLAMRSTLSNVAAGGILLTLRPYREGDRVQLGGQRGTVVQQGLYATTLRADDGVVITLPNDRVLAMEILNDSRHPARRIDIPVVIPSDAALDDRIALLIQACIADERVLTTPAPAVTVEGFDDQGVHLVAHAWVGSALFAETRSDLLRSAHATLRTGRAPALRAVPAGEPR